MLGFLDEEETLASDRVNGLSELIFEVVSGHASDLHSKGETVLAELLGSKQVGKS